MRRQRLWHSDSIGVASFVRLSTLGIGMALSPSNSARAATGELAVEITSLSASELSRAIHARGVSCVEVLQAYLARIKRYNPAHNAIVSMVDVDNLIRQAIAADAALDKGEDWGWLHGMPHAVKDLANVEGLETSQGSRIFAGTIATEDNLFVARIRQQGAIFIGKTNTPEFGLGSQSYNDVHGTTRNAYDRNLTAGGSSGGAAVGLATQMLPVADGSDMMGSLRNPGAFNNVVGFRPSQGRVPSYPNLDHFYQQLGVAGPMGRNVEDTIRLLGTMAGFDARAPMSLRDSIPAYERFRNRGVAGVKIGWLGNFENYLPMEAGVLELCESSLKTLSSEGAAVAPCQPDYDMARLWQTWLTLRHWAISGAKPLYDNPDTRKLLKPEVVWEIEGGLQLSAGDIREAGGARTQWYDALTKLFDTYDILALPSAQVFAFSAELHWPKEIGEQTMDTYHRWMEVVIGPTLAGLPVVNLPVGFDATGRAMGVQFIGPMGADVAVLEFALAYEATNNFLQIRPG